MSVSRTCLGLLAFVAVVVTARPAPASVCFELDGRQFTLEVTTFGPNGFFSVAGEMVSGLGRHYPVSGGGRLQADSTALFGATAYYHERFTTCCEGYTIFFEGVLSPPDYNSGTVKVLSSGRSLVVVNSDTTWSPAERTLVATACP